jgi:hypothetical protein
MAYQARQLAVLANLWTRSQQFWPSVPANLWTKVTYIQHVAFTVGRLHLTMSGRTKRKLERKVRTKVILGANSNQGMWYYQS